MSSKNQDALPKVVVCGQTENNIPKLLMCDERYMNGGEENLCTAPCNENAFLGQVCPPKPPQENGRMQAQLAAGNACLQNMQAQLQCEIFNKNLTIDRLNKQICSLQCEMSMISTQNAMLNEKIQQALCQQQQEAPKPPRGRNLECLENRLDLYGENTKLMEKQLVEMESYVKAMKDELSKVLVERAESDKKRKVFMLYPNPWCGLPFCPPQTCPPQACPLPTCPLPMCPLPTCPLPTCPLPTCPLPTCPLPTCPLPTCPLPTCPPPSSKPATCPRPSPPSSSGCKPRSCSFKPNMFIKRDFSEIYRNLNYLVK